MAQFAGLLDSYAVRPDWSVAGVDYYVGARSSSLKNPATISMSGVSVDTGRAHIVTVSGSNVTLTAMTAPNGRWSVMIVDH